MKASNSMGDGYSRIWIPAVFVLLAIWFFLGTGSAVPRIAATESFDPSLIKPGPRRTALLSDPPSIEVAGFQQRCSECHGLFESPPETERELLQHADIRLNHGMNNRCFNCHSRENRDMLILQGTREVGFEDAVQLCAKCHGPTFRDWQKGMHGRTTGSWVGPEEGQKRLLCIQCHDPHSPAFPSYKPLPGPNTLRMSPPPKDHPEQDQDRTSPLLRWQRHGEPEHSASPPAGESADAPHGSQGGEQS